MKKLVFLLAIVLVVSTSFAQRTITDTLQGNETVNFTTMQDPIEIQVLATQLGGTSDGSILLQGSVDGTTFQNIQPTADSYLYFPDDTADLTGYTWTITNAGSILYGIQKRQFTYYRIRGAGTASDTTKITIKWIKWNRSLERR